MNNTMIGILFICIISMYGTALLDREEQKTKQHECD